MPRRGLFGSNDHWDDDDLPRVTAGSGAGKMSEVLGESSLFKKRFMEDLANLVRNQARRDRRPRTKSEPR
jgi:hypothetical protein